LKLLQQFEKTSTAAQAINGIGCWQEIILQILITEA